MSVRPSSFLVGSLGGLLLGGLVGVGCTLDSSSSAPVPDASASSTAPSAAEAPPAAEAPAPTDSLAPSDPDPPSASPDSARTVARKLADASVKARIKQALVRNRTLRRFDVAPEVTRGHVVLRGTVDTRTQVRRVGQIVQALDGVETVTNQVTATERPSDAER